MSNIDRQLEIIKDTLGIDFLQTVNGRELKGYIRDPDGSRKIYLSSVNCLELSEVFIQCARYLEAVDANYKEEDFVLAVKERMDSLIKQITCRRCDLEYLEDRVCSGSNFTLPCVK